MLKVSVITVCFNAQNYIEQTIKSVVEQKDCDIEYIVIDGASTDRTHEIIKKYDGQIGRFISEPDKGIADAMNKGANLASGDYLVFLHADDYLVDDLAISKATSRMTTNSDIYAFDVLFKTKNKEIKKHTKPFWPKIYLKTPVMHQGAFCSKSLFEKVGGFDDTYEIAMDYDFFYKAYQQKATIEIYHEVVSVMRDTGVSSRQDRASLKQRFGEEKRVHFENNSTKLFEAMYRVYWPVYKFYREVRFFVDRI